MREVKREGGESRREGTGRGVGGMGAWSLKGRTEHTGNGEVLVRSQCLCMCAIVLGTFSSFGNDK